MGGGRERERDDCLIFQEREVPQAHHKSWKARKEAVRRKRDEMAANTKTHVKITKAMAATGAMPNGANDSKHRLEYKSSTPDALADKSEGRGYYF